MSFQTLLTSLQVLSVGLVETWDLKTFGVVLSTRGDSDDLSRKILLLRCGLVMLAMFVFLSFFILSFASPS